jgi:hypothetical protein
MKERIKETLELRQSGLDEFKFLGEDTKIREIPSLLGGLKSIGDGVPKEEIMRVNNSNLMNVEIT